LVDWEVSGWARDVAEVPGMIVMLIGKKDRCYWPWHSVWGGTFDMVGAVAGLEVEVAYQQT